MHFSVVSQKGRMLNGSRDLIAVLLPQQPTVLVAAFAPRALCWLTSLSLSVNNPGPVWPDGPWPVSQLPSQVQGFAHVLIKLRKAPVDPVLQAVRVPLDGSPALSVLPGPPNLSPLQM